jgi:hypothetical protein
VSQKGEHREGGEQRKAEPVLLLDVDTFKAENPEAEAFLNSDLWKKLQEHIRVLPKEAEPDAGMGVAPPGDQRDGGGGGAAQPGADDGAASAARGNDAASQKRNNELSELSEEERKNLWAHSDSFEDFTAKLEELYSAKRARLG